MSTRVKRIEHILQALKEHNLHSVLDVGCARGHLTEEFRLRGYDVVGLDVEQRFLNEAGILYPKLKTVLYNGRWFPFPDKSFDTVIMNDVLEHVRPDDTPYVIDEAKRVLREDGRIFISVANKWQIIEPHTLIPFLTWFPSAFWEPLAQRHADDRLSQKGRDSLDIYPYTRGQLEELLREAGLLYEDKTLVYVLNKFDNPENVNDSTTRYLIKFIKKTRLESVLIPLALKVSVLLYVARSEED